MSRLHHQSGVFLYGDNCAFAQGLEGGFEHGYFCGVVGIKDAAGFGFCSAQPLGQLGFGNRCGGKGIQDGKLERIMTGQADVSPCGHGRAGHGAATLWIGAQALGQGLARLIKRLLPGGTMGDGFGYIFEGGEITAVRVFFKGGFKYELHDVLSFGFFGFISGGNREILNSQLLFDAFYVELGQFATLYCCGFIAKINAVVRAFALGLDNDDFKSVFTGIFCQFSYQGFAFHFPSSLCPYIRTLMFESQVKTNKNVRNYSCSSGGVLA